MRVTHREHEVQSDGAQAIERRHDGQRQRHADRDVACRPLHLVMGAANI